VVDFRIHYLRAFVVNCREAVILRDFVFEHNKVNVMSEIDRSDFRGGILNQLYFGLVS